MILDGLEGDSSAGCDATGWFLCCGLLKYQMAMSRPGHYPFNQLTGYPNHCFPTTTIDLDVFNG
jgi:hypothetical protein